MSTFFKPRARHIRMNPVEDAGRTTTGGGQGIPRGCERERHLRPQQLQARAPVARAGVSRGVRGRREVLRRPVPGHDTVVLRIVHGEDDTRTSRSIWHEGRRQGSSEEEWKGSGWHARHGDGLLEFAGCGPNAPKGVKNRRRVSLFGSDERPSGRCAAEHAARSAEDPSEKTAAHLTRILRFFGAEGDGGPPGCGKTPLELAAAPAHNAEAGSP